MERGLVKGRGEIKRGGDEQEEAFHQNRSRLMSSLFFWEGGGYIYSAYIF